LDASTKASQKASLDKLESIARDKGVSHKDVLTRAAIAVSSKGSLTDREMFDAIEAGFDLSPGDSEIGGAFTGAAMAIMRVRGGTAREAMGFVQAVGKSALVSDPRKMAQSVGPAVSMGIAGGQTPQEAGALWSAFTLGMQDTEGRIGVMAVEATSRQLPELLPDVATHKERMDILATDVRVREDFLDTVSIRGRAKVSLREFVSREGPMWDAYQAALAASPSFEESGQMFAQKREIQQSTPLQKTATLHRMLDATAELLETGDVDEARRSIMREGLTRILGDTGTGAIGVQLEQAGMFLDPDAMRSFQESLAFRERQLRVGTREVVGGGMGFGPAPRAKPPSESKLRDADQLQVLQGQLEVWIESQKESNGHLEELVAQGRQVATEKTKPSQSETFSALRTGGE
jgi:hypothetical protein